jgi:hypothetical protein
VAVSQADKAAEYAAYAEHCLKLVKVIPEQESRFVCREMAGEWLRLSQEMMNEAAHSSQPARQRRKTGRARP